MGHFAVNSDSAVQSFCLDACFFDQLKYFHFLSEILEHMFVTRKFRLGHIRNVWSTRAMSVPQKTSNVTRC